MVAFRYEISLLVFSEWDIELNTRREIQHIRAPMYHSVCICSSESDSKNGIFTKNSQAFGLFSWQLKIYSEAKWNSSSMLVHLLVCPLSSVCNCSNQFKRYRNIVFRVIFASVVQIETKTKKIWPVLNVKQQERFILQKVWCEDKEGFQSQLHGNEFQDD